MEKSLQTTQSSRGERLAAFAVDVVYGRRRGRRARALASLLRALSWLFTAIVKTRLWLYEKRILRNKPLGCMVVVVGNLTVGGTGKTPVVEKFARSLAERGRRVAILSRGYKSRKEPLYKRWWRALTHGEVPPPRVVSDGENVLLGSLEAGDEPYMLARNLPGVLVLVDKNRVKAGQYAIRKFGADTLILDDGFQYLPLKGRLNLLLIDAQNPFGNGRLLPRGILREPVEHLRRADHIFLTKSDGGVSEETRRLIQRHKPGVELIECAHAPQYLESVGAREDRLALEDLRGKKVAALSAIAVPESFEAFLRRYGAQVRYTARFLDHHRFSEEEIERCFRNAVEAGLDMVVTTEKDAVRLDPQKKYPLPFYFLRLEIEILQGADDFETAVSRLCFPKSRMNATRPPFPVEQGSGTPRT